MIISYQELLKIFRSILLSRGFTIERADLSAKLFADASLDGVYTHGVNRFPVYIKDIDDGIIRVDASPAKTGGTHSYERYDGNLGPGNLNAWFCMNRAIELASIYETGCVAINNTNHWMRAGSYGWQAAEQGFIAICTTNTCPNMPPWGGNDPKIGNNPIVIAVPRKKGSLVLDMATSQYAFGKLELYAMEGRNLPFPGGFNGHGELSVDPSEIIKTRRSLPVGLWKGSGLTIMTDLLVAALSGGDITRDIGIRGNESGVSQLFMAFKPSYKNAAEYIENKANELIDYIRSSGTDSEILYPGERALRTREKNRDSGIAVNDLVWSKIKNLIDQSGK